MSRKQTVTVKDVIFGQGKPKVCIPIVGRTKEEILQQAKELTNLEFDVLELRIDYLKEVGKIEQVAETLKSLRTLIKQPILFTFRTKEEGGEAAITKEAYKALYHEVIQSGCIDLIDLELFLGEEVLLPLIKEAKTRGILVVVSNHDFKKTPSKEELLSRLTCMQEMGADLPKIAVMPQTKQDVLILLEATIAMEELPGSMPVITMSMGHLGAISRVAGAFSGSAMTFATNGIASAPGQIPLQQLQQILDTLQ